MNPVYLSSLANADARDREPGEKRIETRDLETVDLFVSKWDRKDRGLFFCVSTLRPDARPERAGGSPRSKVNVSEISLLHADVDLKSVEATLEEISAKVSTLPLPPSVLVASGNGLHLYWLLNEGLEANEEVVSRVEAALRLLADLVGGDLAVAHPAALMRLPGTHNTKDGAWKEVAVLSAHWDARYELGEIEEMLSYVSPVVRRKIKEGAQGLSAPSVAANPFLEVAARLGFKPPIDVEQRLSAMAYQGVGETSIHSTQLSVTASLLTKGVGLEQVVDTVLAATRAAAGADGRNWNWTREERAIRRMCEDWQRKNPTQKPREVTRAHRGDETVHGEAGEASAASASSVFATGTGTVVHLEERRKKKVKKETSSPDAIPVIVADGVVETIRRDGGDILLAEGEIWMYRDGVWTALSPSDEQWLRTLVQRGCDAMGRAGDSKVANAAWKRLNEHPDLYLREVRWNGGDVIAAGNGMVDLRSRAFSPHDPSHFARSKVGVSFEAGAQCPRTLRFLEICFRDRSDLERREIVAVIQECFGAALAIRVLAREQRKALFLKGPSRTGKTQLATILRRLIGDPIASPSIVDISKEFGLQTLHGARAWVRDDAVNENDEIDGARFKNVVTGEPLDVNRKGRTYLRTSFEIPVLLTTNVMPRARDATEAIYNRSIVIDMTNVVEEHQVEELRRELGVTGTAGLAETLVELEGPGILNWAIEGLDRLRARGRYLLPASILQAIDRFKDDNSPISAWARVAVQPDPESMVSRKDLRCSFNGWQLEEQGHDARALGAHKFTPLLRSVAPWADVDGYQGHAGERFVTGIRLTSAGLRYWQEHSDAPLKNGCAGLAQTQEGVNRRSEKGAGSGEEKAPLRQGGLRDAKPRF
ncbi:MAG TPA: phage/plasmid primase, P4 family [Microvirga sp.]|nr:phage/plasmid primase, P4 family [Microvirga sp.]